MRPCRSQCEVLEAVWKHCNYNISNSFSDLGILSPVVMVLNIVLPPFESILWSHYVNSSESKTSIDLEANQSIQSAVYGSLRQSVQTLNYWGKFVSGQLVWEVDYILHTVENKPCVVWSFSAANMLSSLGVVLLMLKVPFGVTPWRHENDGSCLLDILSKWSVTGWKHHFNWLYAQRPLG